MEIVREKLKATNRRHVADFTRRGLSEFEIDFLSQVSRSLPNGYLIPFPNVEGKLCGAQTRRDQAEGGATSPKNGKIQKPLSALTPKGFSKNNYPKTAKFFETFPVVGTTPLREANRTNVDQTYANQTYANQTYADQTYADQTYANQTYADQVYANQTYADQVYANQTYADQVYANQKC